MPLDPTGYTPSTVEEILKAIEDDQLALVSPSLDLSPAQPHGQINGIIASKIAAVEELIKEAYDGFDPDKVEGVAQDQLYALRGTKREPASKSTVALTLDLNATFGPYAPGTLFVNVDGAPDRKFTNRDTVQTTLADPAYPATFEAVDTGPVAALAATLVITSPVAGWNSLTQATDAEEGTDLESATDFRLRSEDEISKQGSSALDALRVDVAGVEGVEQVTALENTSLVTDSDGLPGKSFEMVVFDGVTPNAADADIFAIIWANKPSGVQPYGTTTGQTPDKTGKLQPVAFSRVTQDDVYITLTVNVDATKWPVDGVTQVKNRILEAGSKLANGDTVVASQYLAAPFGVPDSAFESRVPGLKDVPISLYFQGFAPGPVSNANLLVGKRERAIFDSSRIVVNVVNV